MNSCLYECHVMHARFEPRRHRFVYRLFFFALDLDELPALARSLPLFSVDRRNVYSFRPADHFPTGEALFGANAQADAAPSSPNLKTRVLDWLAARGVPLPGGRVLLVTLPRVLGYASNPVSFYFCFDSDGAPVATIAEVTNTFREMKLFLLGPDTQAGGRGVFRLRVPKQFYVSPYSDVDVAFDFTLRTPGDRLSIQIDDYAGGMRTLTSTLAGPRRALTGRRLAWFTLKYPLVTLRTITLIHAHAFVLWLKRVPWFAKAARRDEQRELYRPHHSLQPNDAA